MKEQEYNIANEDRLNACPRIFRKNYFLFFLSLTSLTM